MVKAKFMASERLETERNADATRTAFPIQLHGVRWESWYGRVLTSPRSSLPEITQPFMRHLNKYNCLPWIGYQTSFGAKYSLIILIYELLMQYALSVYGTISFRVLSPISTFTWIVLLQELRYGACPTIQYNTYGSQIKENLVSLNA